MDMIETARTQPKNSNIDMIETARTQPKSSNNMATIETADTRNKNIINLCKICKFQRSSSYCESTSRTPIFMD